MKSAKKKNSELIITTNNIKGQEWIGGKKYGSVQDKKNQNSNKLSFKIIQSSLNKCKLNK